MSLSVLLSSGLTVAAGNIPANCDVGRQYQILPFDDCTQSEPDASSNTHLLVTITSHVLLVVTFITLSARIAVTIGVHRDHE